MVLEALSVALRTVLVPCIIGDLEGGVNMDQLSFTFLLLATFTGVTWFLLALHWRKGHRSAFLSGAGVLCLQLSTGLLAVLGSLGTYRWIGVAGCVVLSGYNAYLARIGFGLPWWNGSMSLLVNFLYSTLICVSILLQWERLHISMFVGVACLLMGTIGASDLIAYHEWAHRRAVLIIQIGVAFLGLATLRHNVLGMAAAEAVIFLGMLLIPLNVKEHRQRERELPDSDDQN